MEAPDTRCGPAAASGRSWDRLRLERRGDRAEREPIVGVNASEDRLEVARSSVRLALPCRRRRCALLWVYGTEAVFIALAGIFGAAGIILAAQSRFRFIHLVEFAEARRIAIGFAALPELRKAIRD